MTGTLIQPERPVADSSRPGSPDLSLLQDRVPDALKLPRVLAGMTAVVGGLFWFLSLQPLHHTDVWGHLAYGREIWNTGRLPDTEPLMPLAAGVKWINTAWLTQVLGYAAVRGLGLQVLQALYAGSIALCAGLLLWGLYRRTRSAWAGLLGVGAFLLVDWQQLLVIRPQLAGLVAFVALVVLFTSARRHWSHWVLIPVIFALWANLHGSFIVGLLLMACLSLGRALDVFRRTGRFRAVWRDDSLRRMDC